MQVGFHTIIAKIAGDNKESIHLHKLAGFEDIGMCVQT